MQNQGGRHTLGRGKKQAGAPVILDDRFYTRVLGRFPQGQKSTQGESKDPDAVSIDLRIFARVGDAILQRFGPDPKMGEADGQSSCRGRIGGVEVVNQENHIPMFGKPARVIAQGVAAGRQP